MLNLAGLNCCFLLGQVFFILFCSIFSVESPALALLDLRGRVFNTSSWSYRAIKLLLLSHSLLLHLHMDYSPPHRLQMNISCHTSDDINTTPILPHGHPAGQTHLTHAIRCFLTLALVAWLGLDCPSTSTGSWLPRLNLTGILTGSWCSRLNLSWSDALLPHGETWK